MRENDRQVGNIALTGIAGTVINNMFCNIFGLYSNANYYRLIFVVEGLIIIIACMQRNGHRGPGISIKRGQLLLLAIFIMSQVIAFVITAVKFDVYSFDIHKTILFAGMIYACFFASKNFRFSERQFDKLLDFLIIVGLFACTYNFIINISYFKIRNLSLMMHYTWNFRSFFSTRSSYGIFITFSALAALMKAEKKHGILYLLLYIFFLLNVLITAARTEMAAIFIGSLIYFAHSVKFRKAFFAVGGIVLLFIVSIGISSLLKDFKALADKYYIFFNHMSNGSRDISTGRFGMWKLAFESLGPYSFFFGHGTGSKDAYLASVNYTVLNENLLSFHNGYVDMLFETGILGLGITAGTVLSTLKRINRWMDKGTGYFFYAVIAVVLLINIGDSNALVFSADTLSPLVTVLILAIPNAMVNCLAAGDAAEKQEVKDM